MSTIYKNVELTRNITIQYINGKNNVTEFNRK